MKLRRSKQNITKCPEPLDTRWYTILQAVDWVLQFYEPLAELSDELWHILPASKRTPRNLMDQLATGLHIDELKIQLQFLAKYGKDFWLKEASWSEKQDTIYDFPPGFKSFRMAFRSLK